MRFSDLLSFGIHYAIGGCIIAVLVAVLFFIGYREIYKKRMHGTKNLSKWQAIWGILFVVYAVVLLGATFLSRGSYYEGMHMVPLFASYKEAWYQGRISNLRNIAVNILLFMPFGFWLPLGIKRLRVAWKTYFLGLGTTLVIEVLQLLTKRGIFEWDDILNNLLGTMIGYGFFAIFSWLLWDRKKRKGLGKMLACQLPVLLCGTLLVVMSLVYKGQELGNLSIHYIKKVPAKSYELTLNTTLDDRETNAMVYQVKTYSLSETRAIADEFFNKAGTQVKDEKKLSMMRLYSTEGMESISP